MKIKLKLNQDLSTPKGRILKGKVIEIDCDKGDMPLDRFWRNRLLDSKIDNCVEVLREYSKSTISLKTKNNK